MKKERSSLVKLLGMVLTVMLFFGAGGCGSDDDDDGPVDLASFIALANTDYVTGQAAQVKVDEQGTFPAVQNSTTLDSDPGGMDISAKTGKETVFLAGRQTSTVYQLDPGNDMEVSDSYTIGPGMWAVNPQDVLVVSESKAYVSRYADAYDDLLIIDPRDGSTKGTIDFAGIPTNGDTLARPADMVKANGKVFVAVQNLNAGFNYCEADIEPGIVAVIDPGTDTIVDTIFLNKSNPKTLYYAKSRNEILVASAGNFATDSPGCASFSPDPAPASSGLEIISVKPPYAHYLVISGDHPDINGNIYDVALSGNNTAYVLVAYGYNNEDRARKVDIATGAVEGAFRYPATNSGNDDLSGIQAAEGHLLIGDRSNSGIEVIRTKDDQEVGFQALDLPPLTMSLRRK